MSRSNMDSLAKQLLSDAQQSFKTDVNKLAAVIAIDFGTAASGYAYAFQPKHDNSIEVKFNKNWAEGQGFQSYKTRTCVLVDKNVKFCEFGHEAEERYINLMPNEQGKYEFYDRFKMALHKEKLWGEETKIKSRSGKEANALDIFRMSIEYLRKHIFAQLNEQILSLNPEMIRWVITVPAIWSAGAKQFMRKAAFKAGVVTRLESKRLMIALEPEAASLTCRNLALHRFTMSSRGNTLPHGTDYLLLDCGGGTVDIVAHKVISDDIIKEIGKGIGLVKEIEAASGGPWGGVSVDDNFEKLLKEIFGTAFIDHYKTSSPPNWLDFIRIFEMKKRSICNNNKNVVINVPGHFTANYRKFSGKDTMENTINGIDYADGVLRISNAKAVALFTPIVDKMVAHVKDMMSKPALKNVKYFFIVGGFGDSKILQDAIKAEFEGKVHILIPPEASVAVLEGAVRYGYFPGVITHRRSRKTYGFESWPTFDSSKHPESRKKTIEGTDYCSGCFKVMVEKNEEIKVGKEYTCNTYPVRAKQTKICYDLLETENLAEHVKYADDKGVEKIGELVITSTNTKKGKDRKCVVNYCIGDTELYVNVADTSVADGKGDVQEATLNLVYDVTSRD